jgi:hypothetical protein
MLSLYNLSLFVFAYLFCGVPVTEAEKRGAKEKDPNVEIAGKDLQCSHG